MDPKEVLEKTIEKLEEDIEKIPEEPEPKEWGFLEKLALVVKSGFWGSIAGAVLTASAFGYLSYNDYFGIREDLEQAKEEAVRTIEIREEYVRSMESSVNSEKESVEEEKNKLKEKEWHLEKREVIVNGEKQTAKRTLDETRSEAEKLESIRDDIEREKRGIELDKKFLETEKNLNQLKEEVLEQKEKEVLELLDKLSAKFVERAETCLPYVLSYDHNRNCVPDCIDSEISEKFFNSMSILSQEYLSSVRYVSSPAILKKLEQYGVTGPVVVVNDKVILIYNRENIERTVENAPEEAIYDFEFHSKESAGIQDILSNKKAGKVSPVTIRDPEKSSGSGFVLGNNYIVTAYHVVDAIEGEFDIIFEDGKQIKTSKESIIALSKAHDIALIRVEFDGYAPIALQESHKLGQMLHMKRAKSSTNIEKGDNENGYLYCIECVSFSSITNSTDGELTPEIHGTDMYLSTMNGFPGDSGSAAMNDDGEVIGVVTGAYGSKKGSASMIKAKYLKKLLEQYCTQNK